MADSSLEDFVLVGGTALSLRIGHRISIDLDLFINKDFDESKLDTHLKSKYNFIKDDIQKNTLKGSIEDVAVDLISHKYPYVDKISTLEGIRVASLKDIAAMKLNAIVNNGSRAKDFIDVAFLGETLTYKEMIKAYEQKYESNSLIVSKALLYHNDIVHLPTINLMTMNYDFKVIKTSLEVLVNEPNQTHYIQTSGMRYGR